MIEFTKLSDFVRYIGGRMPLDEDIDVQLLEAGELPQALELPPFRHHFYAVSFYENIDSDLRVGSWPIPIAGPVLFFKTPYQIMSWHKKTGSLRMYCLYFTDQFLTRYPALSELVLYLPFLQLDRAIPFTVQLADVNRLLTLYRTIADEYHSGRPDRLDLIATYLQTLLLQVRRLYHQATAEQPELKRAVTQHDNLLVRRFKTLLERTLTKEEPPADSRSVAYYAAQLSLHPDHLTVVSKRATGQTAQALIQERVVQLAKTLLLHTELSIKEISFRLAFNEPAHFSHYFKKGTAQTPLQYRASVAVG